MDWIDFREHWSELKDAVAARFAELHSLDLAPGTIGTPAFVAVLATAHDLTQAEVREILDDIALEALARGTIAAPLGEQKVA